MEGWLDWGYGGLFAGAFLAATVVPFSSDVLLIALLAAGGDPYTAVAVATLGNWLGGLTSYGIGWLGKWEWIEKYLRIKPSTLERQQKKIKKYGSLLAFMTWLPVAGDVFAVALGFYRTDFKRSAFWMLAGKCLRFILWTLLYYGLFPRLNG